MGSILSFPILCLVTLVSFLISENLDTRYVVSDLRNRRRIRDSWLCGVNGDDLLGCVRDRGETWASAVPCVGGVASRGKTIVNSDAFTVNSELWVRRKGTWYLPGAVRPSLIVGISDGRRASPEVLWEAYENSSLPLSEDLRALIRVRLKAHLPVSMGGLGKVYDFRAKDVRDWMIEKVRQKRQTRKWASKTLSRSEVKSLMRMSKQVAKTKIAVEVPEDAVEDALWLMNNPFRGCARWTPTDPVKLDYRPGFWWFDREETLKAMYDYRWDLQDAGLRVMLVPRKLAMTMGLKIATHAPYVEVEDLDYDEKVIETRPPFKLSWKQELVLKFYDGVRGLPSDRGLAAGC